MKKNKPKHQSPKRTTAKKPAPKTVGQVRIIGGQFKRRNIRFIDSDGLRPTPDRLRETIFNWLIADIHGARVLDCCAGSGVLGFEALSRGSAHCTFIEASRDQVHMLRQSAELLQLPMDSHTILQGFAEVMLKQLQSQAAFDIVFIDPPYAQDLWQPILNALTTHGLIDADTLLYIESDKALDEQILNGLEPIKQTQVGQVIAGLYRRQTS